MDCTSASLCDSSVLHQSLGIRTDRDLLTHPKLGASWGGYVLEEVLAAVQPDEAYFWATHQGAEVDLVRRKEGRLLGVECKRTDAPRMTPSMRMALEDLGLERIAVVYRGAKRFPIAPTVEAVPLHEVWGGYSRRGPIDELPHRRHLPGPPGPPDTKLNSYKFQASLSYQLPHPSLPVGRVFSFSRYQALAW